MADGDDWLSEYRNAASASRDRSSDASDWCREGSNRCRNDSITATAASASANWSSIPGSKMPNIFVSPHQQFIRRKHAEPPAQLFEVDRDLECGHRFRHRVEVPERGRTFGLLRFRGVTVRGQFDIYPRDQNGLGNVCLN